MYYHFKKIAVTSIIKLNYDPKLAVAFFNLSVRAKSVTEIINTHPIRILKSTVGNAIYQLSNNDITLLSNLPFEFLSSIPYYSFLEGKNIKNKDLTKRLSNILKNMMSDISEEEKKRSAVTIIAYSKKESAPQQHFHLDSIGQAALEDILNIKQRMTVIGGIDELGRQKTTEYFDQSNVSIKFPKERHSQFLIRAIDQSIKATYDSSPTKHFPEHSVCETTGLIHRGPKITGKISPRVHISVDIYPTLSALNTSLAFYEE